MNHIWCSLWKNQPRLYLQRHRMPRRKKKRRRRDPYMRHNTAGNAVQYSTPCGTTSPGCTCSATECRNGPIHASQHGRRCCTVQCSRTIIVVREQALGPDVQDAMGPCRKGKGGEAYSSSAANTWASSWGMLQTTKQQRERSRGRIRREH